MNKTLTKVEPQQFKYIDTAYGRLSSFILGDTLVLVPNTQALYDLIAQEKNLEAIDNASPVNNVLLIPVPPEMTE